jgi:hypothetical protein
MRINPVEVRLLWASDRGKIGSKNTTPHNNEETIISEKPNL